MHIRNTFIKILILVFVITQSAFAFGESISVPSPSKVLAYHKPNVTILFNEQELGFTDVNGTAVYPIIYGGTTYIPVRGVSRL